MSRSQQISPIYNGLKTGKTILKKTLWQEDSQVLTSKSDYRTTEQTLVWFEDEQIRNKPRNIQLFTKEFSKERRGFLKAGTTMKVCPSFTSYMSINAKHITHLNDVYNTECSEGNSTKVVQVTKDGFLDVTPKAKTAKENS